MTTLSSLGRSRSKKSRGNLTFSLLFFPLAVLYQEIMLKGIVHEVPLFDHCFLYLFLFSVSCGLVIWLLGNLFRWRVLTRWIIGIVLIIGAVLFSAFFCCKVYYRTYFELGYMFSMTGDVAKDFRDEAFGVIFKNFWFILLMFLPFIIYMLGRKKLIPDRRFELSWDLISLLGAVVTLGLALILVFGGKGSFAEDKAYYTTEYSAQGAINRFGLVTDLRLELKYAIFGKPEDFTEDDISWPESDESSTQHESQGGETESQPDIPIVYAENKLDIDFTALAAGTKDDTLKAMHKYFGSLPATEQNEYTGMFKGKNLIMICAEAFSMYAIDETLTPALWKLTHEGIVAEQFYQPGWTQSTTGGEFAVMLGVVPTWVNGKVAFNQTVNNQMNTSMAALLKKEGYTATAYHNNRSTYYGRNKTHTNLGYVMKGTENGVNLQNSGWPASDLDMFQVTMNEYVDAYVNNGQLFHAYYMSISGHCNYNYPGNKMCRKNRSVIENYEPFSKYSETIQAYLSCQYELELALEYMLDVLEANNMLEDTVIVMAADHYPYALTEGQSKDFYQELEPVPMTEKDPERYRTSLIMWCGSIKEPIVVTDPCSTIDIVPTLCNLFGLEYDSRLYSGRDILATNYDVADPTTRLPIAVFPAGGGYSWVSVVGEYNAYSKKFTPAPGYEEYASNSSYIKAMTSKATSMGKYARLIVQKDYYKYVLSK